MLIPCNESVLYLTPTEFEKCSLRVLAGQLGL